MEFLNKLNAAVEANNSLVCVGLDPNMDKIPQSLRASATPYFDFNKAIIDATADLVCSFKPNSAFYEARGVEGIAELKTTCDYIKEQYPHLPIILDFKRGDIGSTNDSYAKFAFEYLPTDAVTIQPYEGKVAMQPFLDYKDKGIIVLCRMSNDGSGEFQDMMADNSKLYISVAKHVKEQWNANGNCLLVVGATYPDELAEIRKITGDEMVFLVPGVGAQGGDVEATLKAGLNQANKGLIINSSRAIIYASAEDDFAEVARSKTLELRDQINQYRG